MDNSVKNIKLGIAFEGLRDIKPLEIIIERILLPNSRPVILKRFTPHTGLIGYTKLYTKEFFERGEPVDIGIFVTDQDKQNKSVKKTLQEKIASVNPTYNDFSVIGVPDPHFEEWLMTGDVKNYFSLNAADPLPNIDDSPKLTVEYLQRHMNDPRAPLFQVYEDLADSVNLNAKGSMRTFTAQLLSICKNLH